jgi:hypothetical protein
LGEGGAGVDPGFEELHFGLAEGSGVSVGGGRHFACADTFDEQTGVGVTRLNGGAGIATFVKTGVGIEGESAGGISGLVAFDAAFEQERGDVLFEVVWVGTECVERCKQNPEGNECEGHFGFSPGISVALPGSPLPFQGRGAGGEG